MSNITNSLSLIVNGGRGSGNFGHAGRPGLVGGSAGKGGKGSGGKAKKDDSPSKEPKGEKSYSSYTAFDDETEEYLNSHENYKKSVSDAMSNIYKNTNGDDRSVGIRVASMGADHASVIYDSDSDSHVYVANIEKDRTQKLNRRIVEIVGETRLMQMFDKSSYFKKGKTSADGTTKLVPDQKKMSEYLGKKFKEITGKDYTKVDPDSYYSKTSVGDNTELFSGMSVNPKVLFAYAMNEPNLTADSKKIAAWAKSQGENSIK